MNTKTYNRCQRIAAQYRQRIEECDLAVRIVALNLDPFDPDEVLALKWVMRLADDAQTAYLNLDLGKEFEEWDLADQQAEAERRCPEM